MYGVKALGQRMETPFLFWIVHTLKKKKILRAYSATRGGFLILCLLSLRVGLFTRVKGDGPTHAKVDVRIRWIFFFFKGGPEVGRWRVRCLS